VTAAGSLTVGGIAAARVRIDDAKASTTLAAAPVSVPLRAGEQAALPKAVNADRPTGSITESDANGLFDAYSNSLHAKDRAGFLADVDPAHPETVAQQAQLFDNLVQIPWVQSDFYVTSVAGGQTTFATATATVDVAFRHQIAGVDMTQVEERYRFTVERVANGRLQIAAETGTPVTDVSWQKTYNYPAPWDAVPKLHVIKLPHVVLMADPKSASLADANAQTIEAAAEHDLKNWQGSSKAATGFAVFLTPDRSLMGRLYTGVDNLGRGNEVGLTHGLLGPMSSTGYAAARITIDSGSDNAYFTYDSQHLPVIFRHEMAHAEVDPLTDWSSATDAKDAQDTMWAIEGFAEWTAESDAGPGDGPFVLDLQDYISQHGYPKALPPDSMVYSSDGLTANAGYQMGQLAIRYMAKTYGVAKVDQFVQAMYEEDGGKSSVDDAMQSALGTTTAQFTSGWLSYLRSVS
jgi:hypothetical protein